MFMESDSSTTNYGQGNSGLSRFRSAPSSLLENFASGVDKERLSSIFASDEEKRVIGKGGNSDGINGICRYSSVNPKLPPQYPKQGGGQFGYLSMNSMGNMSNQGQGKIGSGLMRQYNSPAGLFSHLPSQSGYGSVNGDFAPFSNMLKTHMNFTSGMSPSVGMLSRITEVENENCIPPDLDEAKDVSNNSGDHLFYNPEFQFGSWNGSLNVAENFTVSIKREHDNDQQLFGDSQPGNRPHILTHHLSLPNTSAEMATMEKLLHLQDSVPCKIRAKRGCATHPRSIAERVRRSRISERMRKLQDLVPNMDKQTNTSDMLDLAVEYIKNLQKEYKTLSEYRAHCKCSTSKKTVPNQ